jgi:UDP-N-acetylmuramate--alanine ligase
LRAVSTFIGVERRFQKIGKSSNGTVVIDDFGHNPEKILATLKTLQNQENPIIAIFQPHGFGPVRHMKSELIEMFSDNLRAKDLLIMPDIYFAGGTAQKDVSSKDVTDGVVKNGANALYLPTRQDVIDYLAKNTKDNSVVVVMGARDNSLTTFAKDILTRLN